ARPSDPDGCDVEEELDGVADEDVAGLEHPVPGEAVVRAVELPAQSKRDPFAAVGGEAGAVELAVERDRAGDALDRQLAGKREPSVVFIELQAARLEADLGVALDVEEVR